MPIEILEMIVKVTVDAPQERMDAPQQSFDDQAPPEMDRQSLVQECVAQVMEILQRQKER